MLRRLAATPEHAGAGAFARVPRLLGTFHAAVQGRGGCIYDAVHILWKEWRLPPCRAGGTCVHRQAWLASDCSQACSVLWPGPPVEAGAATALQHGLVLRREPASSSSSSLCKGRSGGGMEAASSALPAHVPSTMALKTATLHGMSVALVTTKLADVNKMTRKEVKALIIGRYPGGKSSRRPASYSTNTSKRPV